ncbi:MAG: methionyl-tRNA formyltransferase [Magnetococcus sp. DMHC-1]|nr:methionyl-tRNA formyltransferase [Magnetococcales bacterium]
MERWRIVFMGTPDFAVPALQALLTGANPVVGIFTQPDKPGRRGLQLQASPVKKVGMAHAIPVYQPARLRDPEAVATLRTLAPDLVVVAAYGQILSPEILAIPLHGCINIHASLLPRWRGAAPIQHALLAGDTHSGVTIMQMEAGLDTGPILARREVVLTGTTTGGSLHDELSHLGADLLLETIRKLQAGEVTPQPQPETGVTYANKLTRTAGRIDWREKAVIIERQVRALNPWPGAFSTLAGKVVKIHAAYPKQGEEQGVPGEVVALPLDGLEVTCGEGHLVLTELQTEGKKRIPAREWVKGAAVEPGNRFE